MLKNKINKKIGIFLLGGMLVTGGLSVANADSNKILRTAGAYKVYHSQSLTGHSFAMTVQSKSDCGVVNESINNGLSSHKACLVTAPASGTAQLRSNTINTVKGKYRTMKKTSSLSVNTKHKQRYSVTKYGTTISGSFEIF